MWKGNFGPRGRVKTLPPSQDPISSIHLLRGQNQPPKVIWSARKTGLEKTLARCGHDHFGADFGGRSANRAGAAWAGYDLFDRTVRGRFPSGWHSVLGHFRKAGRRRLQARQPVVRGQKAGLTTRFARPGRATAAVRCFPSGEARKGSSQWRAKE